MSYQHFKITQDADGRASSITLDGMPLTGVSEYRVSNAAHGIPTVTLTFVGTAEISPPADASKA